MDVTQLNRSHLLHQSISENLQRFLRFIMPNLKRRCTRAGCYKPCSVRVKKTKRKQIIVHPYGYTMNIPRRNNPNARRPIEDVNKEVMRSLRCGFLIVCVLLAYLWSMYYLFRS
ncbi:uncharacterized protein LOC118510399 [Anopheles stephensi]|uniref:uncharacterized protein LOC118510399 n=1 Tax=Anopheles stephensi TaxID=30069 RepID=UPI001658C20D|nr:uncharacterized protein LOC118510399 [Anopheles stephensi]